MQHSARILAALASGALFLGMGSAAPAQSGSTVGAGYWHTSGSKIIDSQGNVVRIAGINWYGFETPDFIVHGLYAQDYKTVLNTIKSLGYNVIRIPYSNEMVESDPVPTNFTQTVNGSPTNTDLVGQTALTDLDKIVSYAGSIGLRIILDNHRSEAGESNESSGLWYTSAYPQANWVADWQMLATRYSASQFTFNGNPTVIGMDLRNEPHSSGSTGSCWTGDTSIGSENGCPATLTTQNWPVAAETAGNAILAINPHLLIFVEGVDCYDSVCGWQGGNLIGVATNPVALSIQTQLVYSPHDYGPNLFVQPWFNANTTPSSLDGIFNQYWGYISAGGTAPIWLGEFGTDNNSADIEGTSAGSQGQWFQSLTAYLQANPALSWTYFALNGEDSYALLDANYDATPVSSLKQSLLAAIQAPLGGGAGSEGSSGSFTLAAAASSLTVAQGSSVTDTITVTSAGGAPVTLAASGLPSGVTASFGTNPTTGSSVLTLTASSGAAAGSFPLTITGTSGTATATATVAATVAGSGGGGGGTGGGGAASSCHIGYTISQQYSGGFIAAITVNNTGTAALTSFALTWTFANGQTVASLWNGTETQQGANVTVNSLSYNGNIPAGGSYTGIGFQGTWNNVTNAIPAAFAVNGVPCN